MNFKNDVNAYKELISKELSAIYKNGLPNLYDPIHHILSGGKRLRPILCILTTKCFKGNPESALITATALELLHNFTLIHDDIMDKDDFRHGKRTIHNRWNESIAILSGDAILALALNKLNTLKKYKSSVIEKFNLALIEVCEGQALDLVYENEDLITLNEYFTMIDKKTGHMLGLCSELGSIISDQDIETQTKLKTYGMLIGRAFQIQDDLLEITSDQSLMGKSLKSDFLLNKKTYISILSNQIDKNRIKSYIDIAQNDFSKGINLYKKFLKEHNIFIETEKYIQAILVKADKILNEIDVDMGYLHQYTTIILNRKF